VQTLRQFIRKVQLLSGSVMTVADAAELIEDALATIELIGFTRNINRVAAAP
jgi:hypothetical protein